MQIVEKEIPRYDETEVINTFKNIKQVKFFHSIVRFDEIRVTFFPAGYILGASCIYFESNSGNILFTGDYSIANQIAVSGAMVNASPDIVVTESTYGGKSHIPRKELEYQCILKTKEVLERNGKILIPAFAIGRSQEMILLLKSAMSQKIIPEVNVFIDGMVNSVNVVYENNPSALPQNLQAMIKNKQSLFYTGFIKRVLHSEREKLIKRDKPSIFISSSGMLIGGPSVFYAKELLGDTKNALFISGYQDEESPGRRLLELKKEDSLSLDNTKIAVQSEIFKFSFSAHADENQIISFVNSLSPDQVVLIHGDSGAREGLTNEFVCKNVHLPTIGSSIEFPEYKNKFFIIPKQTDNEELSLEQYWETCLHKGIKKISQRELEELFPNQINEIEKFSGFRPDYLNTNFFSVITPEKRIEFMQRKKIYETIGNLEKKLVIYGEQNQFHLGFGVKQDDENMAFHLLSAKQGKPRTRIDAKKILHVFENNSGLDNISEEIQIIEKLRSMERMAAHKVKSYSSPK